MIGNMQNKKTMDKTSLNNNTEAQRYELLEQERVVAFAEYEPAGDAIRFTHTEVVAGNEGKGFGSVLAKQALEDVLAQGRKLIPVCEFFAGYIQKHPEYAGLVQPQH